MTLFVRGVRNETAGETAHVEGCSSSNESCSSCKEGARAARGAMLRLAVMQVRQPCIVCAEQQASSQRWFRSSMSTRCSQASLHGRLCAFRCREAVAPSSRQAVLAFGSSWMAVGEIAATNPAA